MQPPDERINARVGAKFVERRAGTCEPDAGSALIELLRQIVEGPILLAQAHVGHPGAPVLARHDPLAFTALERLLCFVSSLSPRGGHRGEVSVRHLLADTNCVFLADRGALQPRERWHVVQRACIVRPHQTSLGVVPVGHQQVTHLVSQHHGEHPRRVAEGRAQ